MTFYEYFANFSPWLWAQAANHLWQSTLFASLAVISIVLLRASSAKARYAVWLIASAKFVLPLAAFAAFGTLLGVGKLFPAPPKVESNLSGNVGFVNIVSLNAADDGSTATTISTTEPAAAATNNEIYCLLTLAWATGCAFLFALWWKRSRDFKRLLAGKSGAPAPGSRETELLGNAQIRMGSDFPVALIISDVIREPTLMGIWKPTVVLPRGLSENLSDDEFELVLMHELAHAARRDNLIGVLQMALCCLLWFHPLVWFIKRNLLEERERACDEAVLIRHSGEARSYISGLLKVVRFGLQPEQSAAGLASTTGGSNLKKRLEVIMNNKITNTDSKWQRWIVGSTASSLFLLSLIAFITLAQTEKSGAASNEFPGEPQNAAIQPGATLYEVEIYADGKLNNTMELNSPKPNQTVFQYGLYHVPADQRAQTGSGERIYGFQLIPTAGGENSVKVEILALLEDLKTVSEARPFHLFKKQPVATYDARVGERVAVSEMSKLGISPLELKVIKFNRENSQKRDEITRQIQALPDVPYRIVGNEKSPLRITEATGKEITGSQYTKLTGRVVVTGDKDEIALPTIYSVPEVKMVNTSGKTITGMVVGIAEPESPDGTMKWRSFFQGAVIKDFPKISIAPGESYIVKREDFPAPPVVRIDKSDNGTIGSNGPSGLDANKYWLVGFTDKSKFYVSVAQVSFDDGTTWWKKENK